MRSIEYLAQLFPDKTGKELFDIQAEDKRNDELQFKVENERQLAIIEDINQNGGYFRGAFGTDQYYMYKITGISLNNSKRIVCSYEKILIFDTQNIGVGILKRDSVTMEIKTDDDYLDDLMLMTTRIKAEEYEALKTALFAIVPKYFKEEWEERQKEFGRKDK